MELRIIYRRLGGNRINSLNRRVYMACWVSKSTWSTREFGCLL